jgi:hypothetical protein
MCSAFSRKIDLPPFQLSSTVTHEKYGSGIIGEVAPVMIPVVTPDDNSGFPHIYLPFEVSRSYRSFKIAELYRGNPINVGSIHLYQVDGKWCFRYDSHNVTVYFTPYERVKILRADGQEPTSTDGMVGIEYALCQVITGDFTTSPGRMRFAKRLFEEFAKYAQDEAETLASARDEANLAKMESEIEDLTQRLANLEQEQRDLIERKRLVENARAERLHVMQKV